MASEKPNGAPSTSLPTDATGTSTESASQLAETSSDFPAAVCKGNPELWVGKKLGKYQIISVLGQGAMGVVLKAHDPLIERDVAIKVLADHLASDPIALGRFLAEARSAGKLNHPNVMSIYEICQEDSIYYLVLELVTGGSLDDQLNQRRVLPVLEATQAVIDACKGVGAAHAAGVVHRDIKPANFMRASDGAIKVADFGLAKGSGDSARHFTQSGMVVGTPYFMSPEQCEAKPADHRSDIYALGATYFCLLTGECPYQNSENVPQLMYAHCHAPVPDPRSVNPQLPEACSRIVARAMAKAPADRYQTTTEMVADLQAVVNALSGQTPIALPSQSGTAQAVCPAASGTMTPPPSRRVLAAFAGALIVLAIGVGIVLWAPWRPAPDGRGVLPAGPTGDPIKVGVLHSLSGTMGSSEATVVDATLFAIEELNRAGGVLGRPVQAIVADGKSDSAVFARQAERLITQEKVPTVFGCWTSADRKTVKPIFEKHDHLLVYPLQFEGLESSPCIFYIGASPDQQILPAVEWSIKYLQKKRLFVVGSDYVFPRASHAIIQDALKSTDAKLVGAEFMPLGSQHFDEIVEKIKEAKPDMILNTINGDSNIGFFRQLRAAGIKPDSTPTLSFSIGEQVLRSLNTSDVAGDYAAWTYFQSIATPENQEFVKRFQTKYPQHNVTDPMESAYIGVMLWAQAVNECKSLEPKSIRRALLNQRLKGPGGDVRVDPDTQYTYRTPRIGQITSEGNMKIVWTASEPDRPEPYPNTRTAEAWRAMLHDLYRGWGNRWSAPDAVIRKGSKNPS